MHLFKIFKEINLIKSLQYMKKILVTGGNGRFAKELKKINSKYDFIFRNKKQLNILSTTSIKKKY